jgi:hypothetical protein
MAKRTRAIDRAVKELGTPTVKQTKKHKAGATKGQAGVTGSKSLEDRWQVIISSDHPGISGPHKVNDIVLDAVGVRRIMAWGQPGPDGTRMPTKYLIVPWYRVNELIYAEKD